MQTLELPDTQQYLYDVYLYKHKFLTEISLRAPLGGHIEHYAHNNKRVTGESHANTAWLLYCYVCTVPLKVYVNKIFF